MKRSISVILALILILTLLPTAGLAVQNEFKTSQAMVNYIKSCEGFMDHAYKALPTEELYTIGYGHYGVSSTDTITQEEAEELLKSDLAKFEEAINKFADRNGIQLTQQIFDGMLGLTYNIGTAWLSGSKYRIKEYLINGIENYPELEIVDAMAVICTSGGNVIEPLVKRRIREAKVMLYGDYEGTNSPDFMYIICDTDGGTMVNGNRVVAYEKDKPYGTLPTASKDGYIFKGWLITDTGNMLTADVTASRSRKLKAVWEKDPTAATTDVSNTDTVSLIEPPVPEVLPSDSFTDIGKDFWARDAVNFVVKRGLFNGTSETAFSPNRVMTRGMLVTVLYRLSGSPSVDGLINQFTDLKHNAYYNAIVWASHNCIANGWANGEFRPDDPLTRQQLATFLMRYAYFRGYDTDLCADLTHFDDAYQIAEYADEAMCWAYGAGIITGTSAFTLSPLNPATRAQVATMMMRFVNYFEK